MNTKIAKIAVAASLLVSLASVSSAFAATTHHVASAKHVTKVSAKSKESAKSKTSTTSKKKPIDKTKATAAVQYAHATLAPFKASKVHGTATLDLNTKTDTLTVMVMVSGLKPHSVHPEHIHFDKAGKMGGMAFALANLVADAKGNAMATTVIKGKNIMKIPAHAWGIVVHTGPAMAGKGKIPVAQGEVVLGK
ncbi:CHRD domain-containing protein [Ferroacidibacillus organovorans]|uniref:CHRD domain-containing protein n=1 Tax=Ferroacidibacillus organovorans TaxID=1765683 RepID=A0A162TXR6_9BACL|nr:CHRD domain-containing protein [Ferroacidibacillus organovorans]KYP81224.1 hypothetical protein AYJ22_08310 [Ferroacidibacillus organovorans]OAG93923.1 hypothetical protein AYW79_08280 [Ferroacidibacillus organovorans]OPG17692.1 hypothetical protein B2M26_00655 [Ferroacidibacillus organovorans]